MKTFVYIGRFQPFHTGHLGVLRWALGEGEVVLALGSDQLIPDLKNPWYPPQRAVWINECLTEQEKRKVKFVSIKDHPGDDYAWTQEVIAKVTSVTPAGSERFITGYRSDSSSYYLHIFPAWPFLGPEATNEEIHATEIRNKYFSGKKGWEKYLPEPVKKGLMDYKKTLSYSILSLHFKRLRKEGESNGQHTARHR